MNTVDGKWIMEGLDRDDPNCIKDYKTLVHYINEIGFLPLFKNSIDGFSVEELTIPEDWWSDRPMQDPWYWREIIAEEGEIAYGKLFQNKAGFISKEWYPLFAAYRRDCYDFDSRYEDGLASLRTKKIMDVLEQQESIPSNELKRIAGFGKGGEKGFESAISLLQMQTYITVRRFRKRRNRNNEEFGWSVAEYALSEKIFPEEYIRSAYSLGAREAKGLIVKQIEKHFGHSNSKELERLIR